MIVRRPIPNSEGSLPASPPLEVKVLDQGAANAPSDEESVFVFPATLAQRRFWLLDKLHPGGNSALNLALPLRLRGPLAVPALRRALNEVAARHEALRTTFISERGELRQLISPSVTLELPRDDARTIPAAEHAQFVDRMIREETERPFALEIGPLIRARLIQLSETEHLLVLTVHHIISDGWSNGVLTRELCAGYAAFAQNDELSLPELHIQFADYADWQHERLEADDFAWQREYWRQQLSGDLPVLDLPTDRPRLKARNAAGDLRSRALPPDLVDAAKALSTREGASPFMLFLAVFQVLLYRYTGQTDFLITTPSANRQRQEFESLIGLFVNPLLLRADLRDDPSFTELLGRVRRVALDGFVNQDVPFELLLDEFQPSRLQVNFLYQSAFVETTTLPGGLSVEPLNCVSAGTVYELSASVFEESGRMRLEFEYNTSLFDAETIERMLGHYETLLAAATAEPAQKISALPLLTLAERAALAPVFASLGNSAVERVDVRGPLVARVMAKPDSVAARHGRRELSCAELLARMETARNFDRSTRAPSDLDQGAMWVAHWRARTGVAPSAVEAKSPEADAIVSASCIALRETMGINAGERVASFSPPGAAATEELGAALLAGAILVYPTPELLGEPVSAIANWIERENVAVAFMAAATWNRLAGILGRKAKPGRLRLVIATEGAHAEGGFGRISSEHRTVGLAGVRVSARTVIESAGGTIALEGKRLPSAGRLRVLEARSRQLLPIGVPGELCIPDASGVARPTNELARWRSDGSLDRIGSINEQFFARGFRLDLRRAERALGSIPGIRRALVRSLDCNGSSLFVAYLLMDAGGPSAPNDSSLRQLLREQDLPDSALPSAFIRLKDISLRLDDGSLDVAALPAAPPLKQVAMAEPVRPYLGLQLQLIAIWEDVLGVRGIGIRDNFFELGGNSLLAMRMLQRTEAACGKAILPTALFDNPTIEHLAGVLAREVIQDSPALLRVNDAGKRTPFFYLHGDLSGGGFYSLKLSRALGPEQPFYVMPPQDIRTLPASPSIEEMAAAHLAALRAVRPNGPYVIGGFCVGGLVAYELAQQLRASGEKVEMLLIIDAAPEDKVLRGLHSLSVHFGKALGWSDEAKVAHFERWILHRARLALWGGLTFGAQTRIAFGRIYNRFRSFCRLVLPRGRPVEERALPNAEALADRDVPSAFLWASASYRLKPYDGAFALLLSEDVLSEGADIAREWKQLAPGVTVHPLTGSHLECITAHVDTLAETIEQCLQSVSTAPRGSQSKTAAVTVSGGFGN
jgi:non-ribosomal peptide synthetase component F/thioesterase domain-containing protein